MYLKGNCDVIKDYKIIVKCKENCHQAKKIEIPIVWNTSDLLSIHLTAQVIYLNPILYARIMHVRMFVGTYLSVYEEWKLFTATEMYVNKDEIPAQWLIGFILQGFECTKEMRSVSKSLPLNQCGGIFVPVLEFAQDVAYPNRKDIKNH